MVDGSVTFTWGGDERRFRLPIDQCLALEEKRGCGLAEIRMRLVEGRWYVADVRETIRLGLMGVGVEALPARQLVDEFCSDGRLQESVLAAVVIVSAALVSPENEPAVGNGEAAAGTPGGQDASPLPRSTAPARRSATRRRKSAK